MKKHVIDTGVYIDLIRGGPSLLIVQELYAKETPGIYFSSVVAQELFAGAHSVSGRRRVQTLVAPFERSGRIVTPTHRDWKETGDVLARILRASPEIKSRLPRLVNDCLIALSARSLGATVYTRNRADFALLQRTHHFSLVVVG